jgi:PAS domain-containing protein
MSSPDHSDPPRDDEHLPLHALLAPGADLPPVERFPPFQPEDDPLQALVAELRNYQRELEIQNRVLDYSQAVAESASERFEALFASIPLPLLVVDEHDMVVQANAMAHSAFQPSEHDRLLVNFSPFVHPDDAERVRETFAAARELGRTEAHEVCFDITEQHQLRADLHVACIAIPQQSGCWPSAWRCSSATTSCSSASGGWSRSSIPRWTPSSAWTRTSASPSSTRRPPPCSCARRTTRWAARWSVSCPMRPRPCPSRR